MSDNCTHTLPMHNVPAHLDSSSQPSSSGAPETSVPQPEAEELPAGYPKLAERMGQIPETAIFRRFGTLNAQNILYLQAELVSMESRLRKLQRMDSQSNIERKREYAGNWYILSQSEKHSDQRQWKLVRRIRQTLKEYNSAIIEQARILRMRRPGAYDMDHIQQFLESYEMGPLALTGMDAGVWGSMKDPKGHAPDLLALLSRHDEDFFSKWVTEKASTNLFRFPWLRQQRQTLTGYDLECFEDDVLLRWTHRSTSVLASALPIVSITILYSVDSLQLRLGIIAIFNLVLSFCLTFFTTAKATDIFAVAAAFSAVQVVFVQVGAKDDVH